MFVKISKIEASIKHFNFEQSDFHQSSSLWIHLPALIRDRPVDSNHDDEDEQEDHENTEYDKENNDEEIDTLGKLFCLDGMNNSRLWPIWPLSHQSLNLVHLLLVVVLLVLPDGVYQVGLLDSI